MQQFKRILVANRGEIAIRIFRACKELGIRSVAIYSEEDSNALFRTKADESYKIGRGKAPVEAYLSMHEIIELAKAKAVDAIHPGYGFLAENTEFARLCEEAGIVFIGPTYQMMEQLGDKVRSKLVASKAGVPAIPGVEKVIRTETEALKVAAEAGYPIILKASAGGGGRGMRVVRDEKDLINEYRSARSEAGKAFGIDDIFIEKYIENPKHIEVQVLGDNYGNLVHLFERDCSIQRRHQKVIEFTPAFNLSKEQRQAICEDALKIARAVSYRCAGTVEFLMDQDGQHYFIEVNPRIQVEHTVTEMVTGIDLVQAQILVSQGYRLDSPEIGIRSQADIKTNGYAIQCRLTTEDPENGFAPDMGTLEVYRSGSGFGIRLDGGNGFTGARIMPYYDSLLVKVTAWSRTFDDAANKAARAISEFKIKGIKTNIGFLLNVLNHPVFRAGNCDTGFIAEHPELFRIRASSDRELKVIRHIGNIAVNRTFTPPADFDVPVVPEFKQMELPEGTKQILDQRGPAGLSQWILDQKRLLITDATMRDAQQSLVATRLRTIDMTKIAPAIAALTPNLFSLEMWGGATFDVAYRFLRESPWDRLAELRELVPNILFQMLFRGANAVGYKNYPDNVVREFIKVSAREGIDVFRIFDSLNWFEGMEVAIDEVLNQGKVAEACICYTGDITDRSRKKYDLNYYVKMAKRLEKAGSHILGIKDMAGLLKPMAAHELISTLKQEVGIPIHLHTHDTSGNGGATLLMAAMADIDIIDAAFSSMAGLTSQPSLNAIAAALEHSSREVGLSIDDLQKISDYWWAVRPVYEQFESELKSGTAEIYKYEIPGGQYSNLRPQVESIGLGDQFEEVKEMFRVVNEMWGDIVKVTPSSKAVGDMAIFMVQNGLTPENIYEKAKDIDFPDSVVSYFEGMMGQPEGGFPEKLQKLVLKGKPAITVRPGTLLPDEDFDAIRRNLEEAYGPEIDDRDVLSYALYPKVYEDYRAALEADGDLSLMGSDVFFHGLWEGETANVKIEEGKELVVRLIEVRSVDEEGNREVVFEINGNRRGVTIKDNRVTGVVHKSSTTMADPNDPGQIGANMPGIVIRLIKKEGDNIAEGEPIGVLEAMKMETNILSPVSGQIEKLLVEEGSTVVTGELLAVVLS